MMITLFCICGEAGGARDKILHAPVLAVPGARARAGAVTLASWTLREEREHMHPDPHRDAIKEGAREGGEGGEVSRRRYNGGPPGKIDKEMRPDTRRAGGRPGLD
jgi:hypothetical protein